MTAALLRGAALWLLLVPLAIANGVLRDAVLAPLWGPALALPASGVLLSGLIFLAAFLAVPLIGRQDGRVYRSIGLLWLTLTLAFEVLFGRYVAGTAWKDLMQVFDLAEGNLFPLALTMTAVSPWLAARTRGLIRG